MALCLCLILMQSGSGIAAVTAYTGSLLASVFPHARNLAAVPSVVGSVVGASIAIRYIDRSGRRPLLVLSCVGVVASHAVLAAYFFQPHAAAAWRWAAFVAIIGVNFSFNLGHPAF